MYCHRSKSLVSMYDVQLLVRKDIRLMRFFILALAVWIFVRTLTYGIYEIKENQNKIRGNNSNKPFCNNISIP